MLLHGFFDGMTDEELRQAAAWHSCARWRRAEGAMGATLSSESRHFDQKSHRANALWLFLLEATPHLKSSAKQKRVRISHSEIDKLACQAKSADIFAAGERPATAAGEGLLQTACNAPICTH